MWVLMHRMRFGRHVTAIGFGEEGALYAGVDTKRVLRRVYMISGLMAGLAATIFIAKNGQAKSDAGTGYELLAITMAVLGGTSTSGGRGTLHGTVLGLLVIVILQNGLRLCGQPADIANMLIGVILISAILMDRFSKSQEIKTDIKQIEEEEFSMKNGQLAILCIVILAAAGIIAMSNQKLADSFRAAVNSGQVSTANPERKSAERIKIGMLPKTKTDPYFVSCREGANAAAEELGVELLWDGPTKGDPEKQNEIVEAWITKDVDVICASVLNRDAIEGVLKKAMENDIKVITWDADANEQARQFFINQATSQGIGNTLADEIATLCGKDGEYVIISAGTTDANQNEWIRHIKARMADKYPNMDLKEIRYSEGERDKAMTETRNVLNKYPKLKGILAIAAPAVPGAAEGLKQAGRTDIKLSGLSVPSLCKTYVHEDYIDSIILWNTVDLGYLTVQAAKAIHEKRLNNDTSSLDFGRLKSIKVGDGNVYLGKPFVFRKDNIDNFDF
jgi:rhamnose transport system permease protein